MTYRMASIGNRFVAAIIDGIILGIVSGIVGGILGRGELGGGAFFLLGLIYQIYFLTRHDGQTPGKSAMKIRVVKTDGTGLTETDAIIRFVVSYISGMVMGLGYLWALFDSNKQTWHDKAANTYVVSVVSDKNKY